MFKDLLMCNLDKDQTTQLFLQTLDNCQFKDDNCRTCVWWWDCTFYYTVPIRYNVCLSGGIHTYTLSAGKEDTILTIDEWK